MKILFIISCIAASIYLVAKTVQILRVQLRAYKKALQDIKKSPKLPDNVRNLIDEIMRTGAKKPS